jgi:hypothetical protein
MDRYEQLGLLAEEIAFALACAPDQYPVEDFLPPDKQDNLDRNFAKMRIRFDAVAESFSGANEIEDCRSGIEASYQLYKSGDRLGGLKRLNAVHHILYKLNRIPPA